MGITNQLIYDKFIELTEKLEAQPSTKVEIENFVEKIDSLLNGKLSILEQRIELLEKSKCSGCKTHRKSTDSDDISIFSDIVDSDEEDVFYDADDSESSQSESEKAAPDFCFSTRLLDDGISAPPPPTDPGKSHVENLLISDSIMRHVEVPKETLKTFLPGARPSRIWSELSYLSNIHTFTSIIIHVGTNLFGSHDSRYFVEDHAQELCDFFEGVRELFPPTTKITFSQILPRESDELLPDMNYINSRVARFIRGLRNCHYLTYPKFWYKKRPQINKLLCRDAVHLSYYGVETVERRIRDFIISNY